MFSCKLQEADLKFTSWTWLHLYTYTYTYVTCTAFMLVFCVCASCSLLNLLDLYAHGTYLSIGRPVFELHFCFMVIVVIEPNTPFLQVYDFIIALIFLHAKNVN